MNTANKITVNRSDFRMITRTDENPDLSHLGEYAALPGEEGRTIDRLKRGGVGRGEYRYFVASMSGEETGNPASVEQDFTRMEDYNRGNWYMTGIAASVTLRIPQGDGGFILHTVETPGLWGIESDSDEAYVQEVFREECSTLVKMIQQLAGIELVD